jgi:hypothetical protein
VHRQRPIVTHDTLFQLVREAVVEVLAERGLHVRDLRGASCADAERP